MPVTGWKLDRAEREQLLERFPPEWPDVIADHITLDANADGAHPILRATHAEMVGGLNDSEDLQTMVVAIQGRTLRNDTTPFASLFAEEKSARG